MIIGGMACLSFLILAAANATPAAATNVVEQQPAGQQSAGKPAHIRIDESRARRIAWEYGLIRIEEIALSGSRWEIAGRDTRDDEMALDIDAHSGAVSR
jgi:hypothetical protein